MFQGPEHIPLGIGVLPERGGTPLAGAWKPLTLPFSCWFQLGPPLTP